MPVDTSIRKYFKPVKQTVASQGGPRAHLSTGAASACGTLRSSSRDAAESENDIWIRKFKLWAQRHIEMGNKFGLQKPGQWFDCNRAVHYDIQPWERESYERKSREEEWPLGGFCPGPRQKTARLLANSYYAPAVLSKQCAKQCVILVNSSSHRAYSTLALRTP